MNRRQFVCALALSTSLSGCVGDGFGRSDEQDSSDEESGEGTVTRTETETPEGEVPECYPSMCEGQQLVEVVVEQDFSSEVKLQLKCRDEEISIEPGESERIDREEDGEECKIAIHIDGEQEYSEQIEDYAHLTLTVTSEGEFEEEWIVR